MDRTENSYSEELKEVICSVLTTANPRNASLPHKRLGLEKQTCTLGVLRACK
jgi:hypothetical protein